MENKTLLNTLNPANILGPAEECRRAGQGARIGDMQKRLFAVKEAVFYLSISRATLYRLVENNDVKSILIGKRRLFDVHDLDDFIEALKN